MNIGKEEVEKLRTAACFIWYELICPGKVIVLTSKNNLQSYEPIYLLTNFKTMVRTFPTLKSAALYRLRSLYSKREVYKQSSSRCHVWNFEKFPENPLWCSSFLIIFNMNLECCIICLKYGKHNWLGSFGMVKSLLDVIFLILIAETSNNPWYIKDENEER